MVARGCDADEFEVLAHFSFDRDYSNGFLFTAQKRTNETNQAALRAAYEALAPLVK